VINQLVLNVNLKCLLTHQQTIAEEIYALNYKIVLYVDLRLHANFVYKDLIWISLTLIAFLLHVKLNIALSVSQLFAALAMRVISSLLTKIDVNHLAQISIVITVLNQEFVEDVLVVIF